MHLLGLMLLQGIPEALPLNPNRSLGVGFPDGGIISPLRDRIVSGNVGDNGPPSDGCTIRLASGVEGRGAALSWD